MSLLLLWGLAVAMASSPEVWSALYDGRLAESADREPSAAIAVFEAVLTHLPEDDSIRGELLYWLGRARWGAGLADGARESLELATSSRGAPMGARALLGRVLATERRVRSLPLREDYSGGTGPWSSSHGDVESPGRMEVGDPGGAALAWDTDVYEGADEMLVMAFGDLKRGPQRFRMFVRADKFSAHLRIVVEDEKGQRWSAPLFRAPTDQWVPVDLGLDDFAPANAPAAGGRPLGRNIRWLMLRDVTAFHSSDRGLNTVLMDDLEIR